MRILFTLFLFFYFLTDLAGADAFTPGQSWNDTSGSHINAHGGCVVYSEGVYYWFGEDRTGFVCNGISCYSSTDLYNWKRVGLALRPSGVMLDKDTGNDIAAGRTLERPKVIYNAATGKWVMWIHWENGSDYGQARVCVATSDQVQGPYEFHDTFRPNNRDSRDQTLFLDREGKAYHFCSTNMNSNIQISLLNEDYLGTTEQEIVTLVGQKYEAPAIFRLSDTYFGVFSGCTGWDPNPGRYAYSYSVLSPWIHGTKEKYNDGSMGTNFAVDDFGTSYLSNTTYKSQSAYVFQVENKENALIYMGDRWNAGNVGASTYVWLPLSMRSGYPAVRWYDRWDLSVFEEMYRYKRSRDLVSGHTYTLLDKYSNRLVGYSSKGLRIENDELATGLIFLKTDKPYVYKLQNASDGTFWSVIVGSSIRMIQEEDDSYGQEWYFEYESDGYFRIKNLQCGQYLSVSASNTHAGSAVYLTDLGRQYSQSFGVYFDSVEYPEYETVDIFSHLYRTEIENRMREQLQVVAISDTYISRQEFDLYPTVGSGAFTIESVCGYTGTAKLTLIDASSGIIVLTSEVDIADSFSHFDFSDDLPAGIYLIQILTEESQVTKKLIVHK